jgi:hypothetical protein
LKAKQAEKLGLRSHSQLSPLLEKCCLRLSANESYQNAEAEVEALTGMIVGHSTQQRLVLRQELPDASAKQGISEISVDGGKVRLRGEPKAGSYWRDYKAIRLNSTYYGAFFDDNQSLIDYVNSQPLLNPLVCLADGHQVVWNLIQEFGTDQQRWEILDWYHLKENLYKVGGSLKRLRKAEFYCGFVRCLKRRLCERGCRGKQARNFCAYLEKHRERKVNYSYYQAEQLCSIGSGAVESAIKQIGARIKIEAGERGTQRV